MEIRPEQPNRSEISRADEQGQSNDSFDEEIWNPNVSVEVIDLDDDSIVTKVLDKVVIVFPKVEPLPWDTFFILSFTIAMPAAVYLLLFTKMGMGIEVFSFVSKHLEQYAWYLAAALAIFVFSLYMLDFSYWDTRRGILCRTLSWSLFIVGCLALALFMSGEYPYGPICVFVVITPPWLVLIKHVLFTKTSTRAYVSWLSGPLFFISLLTFSIWLIWTFLRDENEWNEVTRLEYAEEAGCEPNFEDYPNCTEIDSGGVCFELNASASDIIFPEGCSQTCVGVYDGCLNTFIVWVGPLLVSLSLFFLSFFCTFLRTEGTNEKDIINFGKLWIFLLFALWVTAALTGIGSGVAASLVALTLASFAGSVIFLASSLSRPDQKEQAKEVWEKMKAKCGAYLDAAKGLAVVVAAPLAVIYLGMSFLNQCVRRFGVFKCSKVVTSGAGNDEDQGWDWVTERTRGQINAFKSWDRCKVFTYAICWGIGFMILQVVAARLTVLFLSWLIGKTSSMGLGAVTGILICVGLLMFLLPPVPGPPIYVTLGIVILPIGKDSMGYVGSMAYSVSVSLAVKLLACAMQQKLIGENLSHCVSVRRFVGINSELIRSMRLILAEPGLGVAKVSILIGGPDWPTSVLCGIMGLDLIPILVGTLPVIALVLPTTLAGSFLYMSSLQDHGTQIFPWAGVAFTICSALSAVVLFGSMLIAAFYLEKTVSSRKEEVEAIPIDEEVKEVDDKTQNIRDAYSEVTQWDDVPFLAKLALILSLACMVACCYAVQLFPKECFAEYELTSTVTDDLNGDWTKLFLPLGQAAILVFLFSCVLLACFIWWARRKAFHIVQERAMPLESRAETPQEEGLASILIHCEHGTPEAQA